PSMCRVLCLLLLRSPRPSLFPYTTLFRSEAGNPIPLPETMLPVELPEVDDYSPETFAEDDVTSEPLPPLARKTDWVEVTLDLGRSEEHTSELQSRSDLVCRLLLEKKNATH